MPDDGHSDSQDRGRVPHLVAELRKRAHRSLVASRVCLVGLFLASAGGLWLFLQANAIVQNDVTLYPPTNITVSDNSEEATVVVDQKLSDTTAKIVAGHDWQKSVLNQASALAARVCIVGLMVFMLQFVMKLFQYYHATYLLLATRADALYISDPKEIDLERAMQFLFSHTVDFGALPSSPIESLSAGMKAVGDAAKKKE